MKVLDGASSARKGATSAARGWVVLLNGAPRSGKSSIADALQDGENGIWMVLGVDAVMRATPPALQPGIGLRPGGERPDLEPFVERSYLALYGALAAHAREGLNTAADVGHHEAYSRPLNLWQRCLARLEGLPVLVVGVHCPLPEIMRRRAVSADRYAPDARAAPADPVPEPVRRWQAAVHDPGIYDIELDTARLTANECADAIRTALRRTSPPTAAQRIAAYG